MRISSFVLEDIPSAARSVIISASHHFSFMLSVCLTAMHFKFAIKNGNEWIFIYIFVLLCETRQ